MQVNSVLVLGAASWNRMVHVDALPQGESATIFEARETEGVGSTGVGKSMVLAALGYNVTLHCALGSDDCASRVEKACFERGISLIVDRQEAPTPQHLNIMDRAGGRYSIFLSDGAEAPRLDLARLRAAHTQTGTIFLSLSASSKMALSLLDGLKTDVLHDLHDYDGANPWYDDFILRADIIQLSDVALQDPNPVIERLLAGRARQVVLTKGSNGAEIITAKSRIAVPICAADTCDSNGAGDAFSVALWHAQSRGVALEAAGRFAAAAAAFAIEDDTLFPESITEQQIDARGENS